MQKHRRDIQTTFVQTGSTETSVDKLVRPDCVVSSFFRILNCLSNYYQSIYTGFSAVLCTFLSIYTNVLHYSARLYSSTTGMQG
jgi:hypothetical protein